MPNNTTHSTSTASSFFSDDIESSTEDNDNEEEDNISCEFNEEQLKDHSRQLDDTNETTESRRERNRRSRRRSRSRSNEYNNNNNNNNINSDSEEPCSLSPGNSQSRKKQQSNNSSQRQSSRNSSGDASKNSSNRSSRPSTSSNSENKLRRRSSNGTSTTHGSSTAGTTTDSNPTNNSNTSNSYSNSFAVLPPPDPSSSVCHSINLLVCTANLGNAPPDSDSWNAWIPKDGKLVAKTQFPVRMNPPPNKKLAGDDNNSRRKSRNSIMESSTPKQRHSEDFSGIKPRKPARRNTTTGSINKDVPRSANSNSRRKKKAPAVVSSEENNSGDEEEDEMIPVDDCVESNGDDDYEAYLVHLKTSASSFDDFLDDIQQSSNEDLFPESSKETKPRKVPTKSESSSLSNNRQQQRKKGPRPSRSNESIEKVAASASKRGSRSGPRPSRSNESIEEVAAQVSPKKGGPRKGREQRRRSNEEESPSSPQTPTKRRLRSKSNDPAPGGEPITPKQNPRRTRSKSVTSDQQLFSKSPSLRTPEKFRNILRSKAITLDDGDNLPSNASPSLLRRVLRNKSGDCVPASISLTDEPTLKTPEKTKRVLRSRSSQTSPHPPSKTTTSEDKSRRVMRSRSSNQAAELTPKTPNKSKSSPDKLRRMVRNKSSSAADNPKLEAEEQPKTPNNKSNDKVRRMVRNKSSSAASPNETSPGKLRRVIRNKSENSKLPEDALKKEKSDSGPKLLSKLRSRSRSRSMTREGRSGSGKGSKSKGDGDSQVPACRRIVEAEISRAEANQIKEVDIKYPRHSYADPATRQLGQYDIIVIGMQEATWDKHKDFGGSKHTNTKKKSIDNTASTDDDSDSDNDDTDDDSDGNTTDDDDAWSAANEGDDNEEVEESKSGKKKKKKKGGLLKKISKAKKTVNTFAGGGKDHTSRPLPASPPKEDGDGTTTNVLGDTHSSVASGDTDDEDFDVDANIAIDATNNKGSTKKWDDTDSIHHGIETNQLPGYIRALSYQFGQMRLLVYYKPGTSASSIMQSLDVLSVNYQATGKAGLANKGGIVAELAVNKTTKLSFLTAHLEAHEGLKHYRARNESFRDILMETGSSKYCDASQSSHFTFAMGDLNYRTKLADVAVGSDRHIQFAHTIVDRRDWRTLNQYDELRKSLGKKLCCAGFQTAYCNFPPTFKVCRDPGYKYNPARSPSYTDRILFKAAEHLDSAPKLLLYEPVEAFTTSDHKPIRSGFSIRLNRELKWKSTAELLLADTSDCPRSPDDLTGIVLPESSKGSIDEDRETMHFFITNIECVINPNNYDHIRKQDKADLPNPKLMFITTPLEAVVPPDAASKKRRFGIGSRSKSSRSSSSESNTASDNKKKIPSLSTSKDTMRPIWKDEFVYFCVQTHTEHGRPIDFTGSQLHISLVDSKNSGSVIGSYCLNLAHMIICSRESTTLSSNNNTNNNIDRSGGGGGSVSHHGSFNSSAGSLGLNSSMGKSKKRVSASQHSEPSRALGNSDRGHHQRPSTQRRLGSSSRQLGAHEQKSSSTNGKPLKQQRNSVSGATPPSKKLVPKPSPAMRAAAASALKIGGENDKLPEAVRDMAHSIHRFESGSPDIYNSIMDSLGGSKSSSGRNSSSSSNQSFSEQISLRSIRLNETLIEGGLITGQFKCDMDVWWT